MMSLKVYASLIENLDSSIGIPALKNIHLSSEFSNEFSNHLLHMRLYFETYTLL